MALEDGAKLSSGRYINFSVLYRETGYFNATSATKPLLHLWSLGIEEQFYLAFPLVLYFAYKRKLNITLIVSIIAFLSFFINIISISQNVERTFYLPQYRHWELLFGSILALAMHGEKSRRPLKVVAISLATASLTVLIITAFLLHSTIAFPGWYALLPVVASVILIWAVQDAGPIKSILSSKPLVFVGLISYPLYLWHWPLFSLAHIINGSTPPHWIMLALIALSFILAGLTYWIIERPLKRIKSWKVKTIPMLVMMSIIGCAGYYTYAKHGIDNRSGINVGEEVNRQINGALWQYTKNENCLTRFKTHLATDLPWWFCSLKYNADPDLLLLGNSYANHLYPGIANNKALKNLNVLSIGMESVVKSYKKNPSEHEIFINKLIENTKSIKYIFISGIDPNADDDYIDRFLKRMKVITSNGAKVVIFFPHVQLADDIKACFPRLLRISQQTCESDLTELRNIHEHMYHLKERVSSEYPKTLYFDVNVAFCDKEKCSSVKNGLPMYRDEYKHFSEFASDTVGIEFARWAKLNLPEVVK